MAFATADRQKQWSAATTVELREKSLVYQLFDKRWESEWIAGAEEVHIPIPTWAGVAPSDRARGANWATAADGNQDVATLTRSGGYSVSNELLWEDVLEVPWAVVERTRSRQVYAMRHQIDTAMYDAIAALPGMTITGGAAGTTFISSTAPYAATLASGAENPILTVLEEFGLVMARANVIDGDASPTGEAGTPFVIMHPEMGQALTRAMRAENLHFDTLTADLIKNNPAAITPDSRYIGTLFGSQIYTWNHLAVPTGTDNWEMYGGCMAAAAVGIRPPLVQYFDPANNQVSAKPAHLLRQAGDWAGVELVDDLHRKIVIHAD